MQNVKIAGAPPIHVIAIIVDMVAHTKVTMGIGHVVIKKVKIHAVPMLCD